MDIPVFADLQACRGLYWTFRRKPWAATEADLGMTRGELLRFLPGHSCLGCPQCEKLRAAASRHPGKVSLHPGLPDSCHVVAVWQGGRVLLRQARVLPSRRKNLKAVKKSV